MEKVDADKRLGTPKVTEHGLKSGAIGFREALIIGIASTAPAYSLAAVIGLVVVTVGVQAPAVLLASFVPMFFVATAFYYMNRADQDCGTTFSWVTRAMGPWLGWIGGWAICVTGILVVGSLADVAARYTYLFLGLGGAADSKAAITAFAVVIIVVMTAVCVIGTELVPRKPSVALEGVAREREARLIVVGTYGEGPFRSAILGSTSHKLLHISETPVLCVPARGRAS